MRTNALTVAVTNRASILRLLFMLEENWLEGREPHLVQVAHGNGPSLAAALQLQLQKAETASNARIR